MRTILSRLNLIQLLEIELGISKNKFIKNLKNNVDDEAIKFHTSVLDVFSQGYSKYKGKVGHRGFAIKKRSSLFDMGRSIAVVKGSYKESGRSLIVIIEINGFQTGMKLYYGFISLFYLIFILNVFKGVMTGQIDEVAFTFIMTLLHMTFLFGMPYAIMRRSIRYLKNEIERDFKILGK